IRSEEAEREKKLQRALEIAKREWENIGLSLKLCGDIGEFSQEDFMIGIIDEDVIIREPEISPTKSVSFYAPTFYPMYFIRNLISMDEKMEERGYKTVEALYVFVEFANKAAERLGLIGTFSMGFGAGYGSVRTGWIAEKGLPVERDIFFRMFFKGTRKNYDWEFFWTSVGEKLKTIFDKFLAWQNDQRLYQREVKPKSIVKPMMV
ncbi:MAG: hypothetical protein HY693_00845, partial [Deltaproteobacteria bacterium]|nr:hypothetical protein [Deltaproteobacteria bacterium]